ncbi:MAG: sigma-70 family RNA polymerase sigma factor [Lachnospiraceae bacterium]|nr:sigma-70 family RNA polymerase sigma factor [Lachnospiraceae bacterium]
MNDEQIVRLYWERDEQAIRESSTKYGAYCSAIAGRILDNSEDARECVNDTWLQAWNCIPPNKPTLLSVFLGRITRNLSFNRYKKTHSEKRGGGNIDLILDELEECLSGNDTPEDELLRNELKEDINRFLASLPEEKRYMFIRRYWHADTITEIAGRFGMSANNVSVTLGRVRAALKSHLTERGYRL